MALLMIDLHQHQYDEDRLSKRVAVLEADRGGLMAAIRHMRGGRLDDRFLNDVLRAELDRSPCYGVLLETIEAEIRCLRRFLNQ
jgi:hypothetical protein